ncbi:MAG TPA: hypothetical protein VIL20_26605 [Sandaracinaceae bacterium]
MCNGLEACVGGRCRRGTELDCDDGIECTADECDPRDGCVHTADDSACPDDGHSCTVERCDPRAGCQRELSHEACDDGVFCTIDACGNAGCSHTPVNARCGTGTCDPTLGCIEIECAEDADCFRGPCDATVQCVEGTCVRSAMPDGTACDDGNPCTRTSTCAGSECRGAESPLCPGLPCVRCSPAGPGCDGSRLAPPGTPCDDGNRCTLGDHCDAGGSCVADVLRACRVTGGCRAFTCNPETGMCEPRPDTTCDDGDPCTVGDACVGDVRAPGVRITCAPDGDPCTSDECQPASSSSAGGCTYPPLPEGAPCDDGDPCTTSSVCVSGVCTPRSYMCPEPADRCVTASCSTAGSCITVSVPDGTSCGLNAECNGGRCGCRSGFGDCQEDGDCECELSTRSCSRGNGSAASCVPR